MIQRKKEYKYRDLICDSLSEVYTLYWLFELQAEGYIKRIERGDTYPLFSPISRGYHVRLKTKAVSRTEILLGPHVYTPDFKFELTEKGLKLPLFVEINATDKL